MFYLVFAYYIVFQTIAGQQLIINEIVSSNNSIYPDRYDKFNDWVEIKNLSSNVLDLEGYWISDDVNDIYMWNIPELQIPPNSFEIIYCSGDDIVQRGSGTVWQTLIDQGSNWKYAFAGGAYNIPQNWREIDATLNWPESGSGFGYGDNDDETIIPSSPGLAIRKIFYIESISDIMSIMLHIDYDDGFIAYINGEEIARDNVLGSFPTLSTLAISNHEAAIYQGGLPLEYDIANWQDILVQGWNVIAIQVHNVSESSSDMTVIPFLSVEYLSTEEDHYVSPILNDVLSPQPIGHYHTNFKLDSDGEQLILSNEAGIIVDSISFPSILSNMSYGRVVEDINNWEYFPQPSPMGENLGLSYIGITNPPVLNINGGFYPIGEQIIVLNPQENIQNRYTINGSIPTMDDEVFSGKILDENLILKIRSFKDGYLPSKVITNSYFNEDLLRGLPVVSLISDSSYFFGLDSGLLVAGNEAANGFPFFGANWWSDCPHSNMRELGCEDWEHPVHIEFFENDGSAAFKLNAGMQIHGHWMRGMPQKAIAIFARNKYGSEIIEHQIFPNLQINQYKNILLRPSGNDQSSTMIRDGLGAMIARDINLDYQEYRQAVLFINGNYWGIYNVREKINEHFIANHHDVAFENLDIIENSYGTWANYGTTDEWNSMRNFLIQNDMSQGQNYQLAETLIDMESWINYLVVELYAGNNDWIGGNYKRWYTPNDKWKFILQDLDAGFNQYPEEYNPPEENIFENSALNGGFHEYFQLIVNFNFKNQFINTFADLFNTSFKPEYLGNVIDSLSQVIYPEMPYHIDRWENTCSYCPSNWIGDGINSVEEWNEELDRLYEFANVRYEVGWDNLIDEFELGGIIHVKLVEQNNLGKIKLNSIIPDSYPWQGKYFIGTTISLEPVPNFENQFSWWLINDQDIIYDEKLILSLNNQYLGSDSIISIEAVYSAGEQTNSSIIINEINYNSLDGYNAGDWIEFLNNSDSTIDLSNWIIKDDNDEHFFEFMINEIIPSGEFLVICRDSTSFKNIHPDVNNVRGNLGFGLSGSGDMVRLYDNFENLIDSVRYNVAEPWPYLPNGNGPTLELKNPNFDNSVPSSWASSTLLGTPAGQNHTYVNLDVDNKEINIPFSLEVGNHFPNPFNINVSIPIYSSKTQILTIKIYDILGRNIFEDKIRVDIGKNIYTWNGVNKFGDEIPSGLYFFHVMWKNKHFTNKIMCIK